MMSGWIAEGLVEGTGNPMVCFLQPFVVRYRLGHRSQLTCQSASCLRRLSNHLLNGDRFYPDAHENATWQAKERLMFDTEKDLF